MPSTLFGVLTSTLDSMMTSGTRVALKSADLVIVPDLKGLTGSDWRRTADLAAQGYKAAEAQASDLLKYQVDEATYAEWTHGARPGVKPILSASAGSSSKGFPRSRRLT